jgi:hypothetical protein
MKHDFLATLDKMTGDQVSELYDELMIKLAGKITDEQIMRFLLEKFIVNLNDLEVLGYVGKKGWRNYLDMEGI